MATKLLDLKKIKPLQPAFGLWRRYQPESAPHRFRARTLPAARNWQRAARRLLAETVGLQDEPRVPFAPKFIERVDKGDHVREKILLRISQQALMPVYLLLPKRAARLARRRPSATSPSVLSSGSKNSGPSGSSFGAGGPLPVVLAFHGHGYGVKDIVGLWEDGAERHTPDGYHQDFGVALCRQGFAVAAPEISCFGERQTDFSRLNTTIGQVAPPTCVQTAMLAFHLGVSVVGLRVAEGRRLVDYLATRRELDCRRLGAMGISGGGMHTFFSTCLDPRIRACVVSGYFCTFRDSILAMHHCPCNFVPGLAQFGEIDDLAGLIAPRPLLVENGSYDPIFPIKAVKCSVARAREVYRVFGCADRVQTDFFEGRHRISGKKAYEFLRRHLGA